MKIRAVRKINFCSGHRVLNHESSCANVHGHNYTAWIYAEARGLDSIGRVIDFSVLKQKIGSWIDENWDHTFLVYEKDHELVNLKKYFSKNKPVFVCSFNPTAENMAKFLLEEICPKLLAQEVFVTKVEIFETENCKAEAYYEAE